MSELRDRLEALAARGTPRGADDVLNAARRDAQSGAAGHETETDTGELPTSGDELPFVTSEPRTRRRRFGSFVAAAGIAALVGIGALAVTAMFGSGGAGSPEGAVRQLADAISHKDPLAAVDVLVPSEVRSLRDTVHAATQRAADLKIVNDASQPLAGVDLSVDHLELTTEPLADGYAKVVITSGALSESTHQAQLSPLLQKAMRGGAGDTQASSDLSALAAAYHLPTFVVAVRHDGRWYVSPAYTALEYAREVAGGPAAAFGSAQAADLGANTPETAVSDALHAWQAGNWDRLMALAPPDELPVYDFRAWIDQEAADTHPDFTIDTLSTSATVNGDTAVVKLNATGTMGSGSDSSKWQVGGTCPANSSGSSEKFAVGGTDISTQETTQLCLAGDLGDIVPFGLFVDAPDGSAPAGGPISIEVVREDGRWFVSPVSTVLDALDSAIQHLDQRTVYTLLGLAYELPPDGTIRLGRPFDVTPPKGLLISRVYAFDGQAGEKIIGEAAGSPTKDTSPSASGRLYTADGDEVGEVDFEPASSNHLGYISSTTLPKSGSYRLVLDPYFGSNPSLELTLWDIAQAPDALRNAAAANESQYGNQSCTSTGSLFTSGESCVSSGVASIPTTSSGTSNTYTYPTSTAVSSSNSSSGSSKSSSSATTDATTSTSSP